MTVTLSRRLEKVDYAIRKYMSIARRIESSGKRIIYLNIGDPLKYDFKTPDHIKEALCRAVRENKNYYSESKGIYELRKAVSEKERRYNKVDIDPDDVLITQGVAEAINLVIGAFVNPGDEVLVPDPAYPPYIGIAKLYNAKPVPYRCMESLKWQPDVEDIREKINDRTKLIVIINPNNPTGAVYDERIIKDVLDVASEYEIPVVSDEIYDRLVYEKKSHSTASLSKDALVIGLNGFSKVYLMTGWRLGYLYVFDPSNEHVDRIINGFLKCAMNRLCVNTPVQYAAIEALRGPQDHVSEMIKKLSTRRAVAHKRISEIEGLDVIKPDGAFYFFPKIENLKNWSDEDFTLNLLKKEGVLVVQGSGFGESGRNHFRLVFLPPVNVLNKAFDKIENFIKRNGLQA